MPTNSPKDDRNKSEAQTKETSFRLRSFHLEDFPHLFELDQLCFRPGIAYSQDDLQAFIFHPAAVTVVAEDLQSRIAAFAVLELYREKKKIVGHIVTVDVHPERRRLGLGRRLMEALEKIAKGSGANLLRLEVAVDDEGAQTFYSRLGFTTVGRLKRYYLHQIDAFSMERSLDSAEEKQFREDG